VLVSSIFEGISLIIDGTECPIDCLFASKEERLLYYSGHNKDNAYSKYNLKYTIGVQISTGRICLINGPDPSSVHDIIAWHGCKGVILIHCHDLFEIIFADKGYQGLDGCLMPFKGKYNLILSNLKGSYLTPSEEVFNEVLASVCQIIECTLQRVKIFGAFGSIMP
jgi:hypothetical protein